MLTESQLPDGVPNEDKSEGQADTLYRLRAAVSGRFPGVCGYNASRNRTDEAGNREGPVPVVAFPGSEGICKCRLKPGSGAAPAARAKAQIFFEYGPERILGCAPDRDQTDGRAETFAVSLSALGPLTRSIQCLIDPSARTCF
jgi:hypothetical protein